MNANIEVLIPDDTKLYVLLKLCEEFIPKDELFNLKYRTIVQTLADLITDKKRLTFMAEIAILGSYHYHISDERIITLSRCDELLSYVFDEAGKYSDTEKIMSGPEFIRVLIDESGNVTNPQLH